MSRSKSLSKLGLSPEEISHINSNITKKNEQIKWALLKIGCTNVIVTENLISYNGPYGWAGDWASPNIVKKLLENKPIYRYNSNLVRTHIFTNRDGWRMILP